tara:strand:+ start:1996 stop:2985 length:990 start_codon:yes stop_codon:yes gene_type:complete
MSKAAELANLIGNINAGGGGVNRNLVINGDMSVSQRATSVASITGAGYKVLDRHRLGGAVPGTWTWSQSTSVPSGQGFGNSLKLDCTATGSAGTMYIHHKMEGQNLQGFAKGTSDAKPFALSFWVRSNKTGTYIAQLLDNDNTRHVSKSYTISSADTWEHKKITFPADTSGAFDNDNEASLEIYLWLSADTSNSSGTLATTWASVTAANNAVGQVNLADSTDNEWYLTGLQLEIGQNPTEFEHEPFQRTLAKCQRYFFKSDEIQYGGYGSSSAADYATMTFPVTMNHDPDMTGVGSGNTAQTISVDYAQCYRVGGYAVWDEGATADCEI